MENFKNLYEITKTVRFELKPSSETLIKLNKQELFNFPKFKSKIFVQQENDRINEVEEKEKNYIFEINEQELNSLVQKCDEKIKEVEKVKEFLKSNSDELCRIWIDNEKIKVIDKDLRYIFQEKKSWKKSFWNAEKKDNKTGGMGVQSDFTVKRKKGYF